MELDNFQLREALEAFIDRDNVSTLLGFIVDICNEKSIHVLSNYQDEFTAKVWVKRAKLLDAVAVKIQAEE